jgi:endonuclease/exonuclease/phosphatase family metal-dependent hydrolase
MRTPNTLVIASYNVHSCVGMDRRLDPERVAAVISELEADIVGIQEIDSRARDAGGLDQLELLARAGAFAFVRGPTLLHREGHYGNGILTRLPVRNARLIDLSQPGREPRGAIDVELRHDAARVRVVATHLGLLPVERLTQCERLLDSLEPAGDFDVSVLLGDFNEWWPPRPLLRRLRRYFGRTRSVRSFPSPAPVFALDRIWVKPAYALREFHAHRSPLARRASDHLPVRAVIEPPVARSPHERQMG